jgi:co-chaperonin GroES (HSP10)
MNWKPIADQVLLKENTESQKTASGIIVMKDSYNFAKATVVAVGEGMFTYTGDKRIPLSVKPGDVVMIPSTKINEQTKLSIDNEEYVLVRESEISMYHVD